MSWEFLVILEFCWGVKPHSNISFRMATYSLMSSGPRVERRGSAFHTIWSDDGQQERSAYSRGAVYDGGIVEIDPEYDGPQYE